MSGLCFHSQKLATDSFSKFGECIVYPNTCHSYLLAVEVWIHRPDIDRYLLDAECIDSYLLYPLQQIHIEY